MVKNKFLILVSQNGRNKLLKGENSCTYIFKSYSYINSLIISLFSKMPKIAKSKGINRAQKWEKWYIKHDSKR